MKNNIFTKDITIKLLSVVCACILWFYVITEQNPVVTKEVTLPVRLINLEYLDKNNMVMADNPSSFKISLKLKGKKDLLDTIDASTVTASADISGHKTQGDNYLSVQLSGLPQDLEWYSKSSDSIVVSLERKISSQRTVEIDILGTPAQGLAVMNAVSTPADIILVGAESKVNKVKTAKVTMEVTGANADVIKKMPVQLLDEAGKVVQDVQVEPADKLVEVKVPIANTKMVPVKFEVSGKPADGYVMTNMFVYPREIQITGKASDLNKVAYLRADTVDITGQTNSINRPVNVVLPQGIEFADKKEEIKVDVQIEKVITKTITTNAIELRNLSPQLSLIGSLPAVEVTLKGPSSLLEDPTGGVKLYIDMRRAEEGSIMADVLWEKPNGVEVLNVAPPQLQIMLKRP